MLIKRLRRRNALRLVLFTIFVLIKTSKMKKVVYLTLYTFCVDKNIHEESRFLYFLCLWDLFLKGIKLPNTMIYYTTNIIIIHFNYHNPFLLLQYSFITITYFYHYNLFASLIFFQMMTTQIMTNTTKLLDDCMTQ